MNYDDPEKLLKFNLAFYHNVML